MPTEKIAPPPEAVSSAEVQQSLNVWQEQLAQLETEIDAFRGTDTTPDWWNATRAQRWEIAGQIQAADDPSSVETYVGLLAKEFELTEATSSSPDLYGRDPLENTAFRMGANLVGRAIAEEATDGPLHSALLENLETGTKDLSHNINPHLQILREMYGLESLTDLTGVEGDEYSQKVRQLLHEPIPLFRIHNTERVDNAEMTTAEKLESEVEWISKAVVAATGMDKPEAREYAFSASKHADSQDVSTILKHFDYFGVDRVRQITRATGIHGLEGYTTAQLERMEQFALNPDALAERLAQHDVLAIFINRVGDHNGVLQTAAENFDDNGRTLYFEIARMGDIYRYMSKLHKSSIKPSTVVLAAHSAPGEFTVADERNPDAKRRDIASVAGSKLVAMANANHELREGDFAYSMHGMKGLTRLVDSYMQPSRAIDDPDEDVGRKKIIFVACDGATEAPVKDIDKTGAKVQIGVESIAGQLGKDLLDSGLKSNVDIYGAETQIQTHKTDMGVRYSASSTMGNERTPTHAKRIRVMDGQLTKEKVDEILIRKAR